MRNYKFEKWETFVNYTLIVCILFLISCGEVKEKDPEEIILARIGDVTISLGEFMRRSEMTIRPPYCSGDNNLHKKIVINSLIAEKMLALEAGEDNDLAYRLADAGGTLRFVPSARVAHFHSARLRPYLRTQMWHGFWRVKLYRKHPRRAPGGDQYAGLADLFAPPLLIVIIGLFALQLLAIPRFAMVAACGGAVAVLAVVYAALRLPTALRLYRRTGDRRMLFFTDFALLRDAARAIGMMRGFWHFTIRRKATY